MTAKRPLSTTTLDRFTRILSERHRAALVAGESFFAEARSAQTGADVSDRLDDSSPAATSADESYELADRAFETAREAAAALDRIRDGTYGLCTVCGSAVSVVRLRALPMTTSCVACARRRQRRPTPAMERIGA